MFDRLSGGEELTFEEGQIIKVLSKCAHSIDDGWWQGELEGRIGNFPSLVVEECDEFGEPLTNQWDETPPPSAPPVFTPPDVPSYLVEAEMEELNGVDSPHPQLPPPEPPAEQVETKPTPGDSEKQGGSGAPSQGFAIALSRDQQNQYGSQFTNNNTSVSVPSKFKRIVRM